MQLWLDDERPAPEGWTLVKSAREAIGVLKAVYNRRHSHEGIQSELTHMSFDHDLADVHYGYWHAGQLLPKGHPAREAAKALAAREQTGYDVLLWMAEHDVWPTEACYVHTHNGARQKAMCGVINRYGPYDQEVRWTPYKPNPKGT